MGLWSALRGPLCWQDTRLLSGQTSRPLGTGGTGEDGDKSKSVTKSNNQKVGTPAGGRGLSDSEDDHAVSCSPATGRALTLHILSAWARARDQSSPSPEEETEAQRGPRLVWHHRSPSPGLAPGWEGRRRALALLPCSTPLSALRPAAATIIATKIHLAASENVGSVSEGYQFFISFQKNCTMNFR